ncbi:cellulose synthase complex periplasmic endoglucanase BcsZ [Halomonas sp. HP20-15]|uniref:cellulose synthase complex periplasmic endoglucanase BcsZ n=1 Tax=Halomonas sp. HP20-15 TaxID=3085901 RepID=UPI002981084C|nr:cellulose synthase complex periplasmic endoglucanase BcsZ [Halomonas sp. HP20-15]MDW5377129.1 cellulose synthase complex periplasmic endoglucanase BcsZ [Halomonas sp. HP20-15]
MLRAGLMLLLAASFVGVVGAEEARWPSWAHFRNTLISDDGRVIDHSDSRHITTSEGQGYALFFALVADDRDTFQQLLDWTQNNLAKGDLGASLPAWLWGGDADEGWGVLDANSAADADLWLAYTLLEAGRLWQRRDYRVLGTRLAARIIDEEVATLPGFGPVLLPGRSGFAGDGQWRVNPSYLPPQLFARLSELGPPWPELAARVPRLLIGTAPLGLAPDWAAWQANEGWRPDPEHGSQGDYDAIRVYLWLGMLADEAADREALLAHFAPMRELIAKLGAPPEYVDTNSGAHQGLGNSGFSAAMLPFLAATPGGDAALAVTQRRRLAAAPPADDAYYAQILTLFGRGWDEGRYRFAADGRLQPAWRSP